MYSQPWRFSSKKIPWRSNGHDKYRRYWKTSREITIKNTLEVCKTSRKFTIKNTLEVCKTSKENAQPWRFSRTSRVLKKPDEMEYKIPWRYLENLQGNSQ
jgi:rRNA maturation protein Nop10